MKVAVIGTGIAGNVAAWKLNRQHDVTVFEADTRIGGHTNTIEVDTASGPLAVDTGFIVYNDRTYPNFIALLDELGVRSQPSNMSFSVSGGPVEYSGSDLNGLFADRRNLLRPAFHRMIRDILRFNRESIRLLEFEDIAMSLGDFLRYHRYSGEFIHHYLLPMGAAIWSAEPARMDSMPARFFVRFFHNHGLLTLKDRPLWKVIEGGSRRYVEKLVAGHRHAIRLGCPVRAVTRLPDSVVVRSDAGQERFDAVFLACHSDQALAMLTDPSVAERDILGAIRYQPNEAVLHRDESLMPGRSRAWASWNYHLSADRESPATLTYHMNRLQGLPCTEQFFVTLNDSNRIDPAKILGSYLYDHPVFDDRAVAAQARKAEIDGANRTYFCGAYWRYGFHEDGVISALSALDRFEKDTEHAELHLQRAS